MEDDDGFQEQEDELQGGYEGFLPQDQQRFSWFEPKYVCKSDKNKNIKADTTPEARLYCSMIGFILSPHKPQWTESKLKGWCNSVSQIVDIIKKLGPKYLDNVNGPCLLIGYYLKDSNDIANDMQEYVTEGRGEKDIYRYVRFWRLHHPM
jgi:hypothetical protein